MDHRARMDVQWPAFLMRSFGVRHRMFMWLGPIAVAGAWFIFPAFTTNFKESMGFKTAVADPNAMVRMEMRKMKATDVILADEDTEEDDDDE